jgi:hypothetical protein
MITKEIAKDIMDWFNSYGLKPYIILPIIMLIVFFVFDLKKIKKWNDLPDNQKRFLVVSIIAEVIVILGSMLQYFSSM